MALTAKKVYAILKRQISDMEAKIKTPIIYRGTVATADLLPLNPDIGDMYNIESKSIYGEAGMNVAWNGVVWDTMGAPIDMSLYIKSSELSDWVKQQNKPTYTAEEVGALPDTTVIPSKTSELQNDSGFLTKIPDNYLSGTDKTLNVSGKAADAKATGDKITELSADISKKLNKNQGSENSGKIAGINESGDIVPMFPVSVDYNEETNCLEFGSDQKMELNKGINLDSTLTKTGSAADAGAVGEITNSLKEDIDELNGNFIKSKNKLDIKACIVDTIINLSTGEEETYSSSNTSDYIEVKKGETYTSSHLYSYYGDNLKFPIYDKNRNFLKSITPTNVDKTNNIATFTSDVNGYTRVVFRYDNKTAMFVVGEEYPTEYIPYSDKVHLLDNIYINQSNVEDIDEVFDGLKIGESVDVLAEKELTVLDNYININGASSSGGYHTEVSGIKSGEVYHIKARTGSAVRTYVIKNISGKITRYADTDSWTTDHDYDVVVTISDLEDGGTLVINTVDSSYIGLKIEEKQFLINGEKIKDDTIPTSKLKQVYNPLHQKTAIFDGDSICHGTSVGSTDPTYGYGWAGRIGIANNMEYKNFAISGGVITSASAFDIELHSVVDTVDAMYSQFPNADYIIFEGGTNDADRIGDARTTHPDKFGTFSMTDFSGNYDITTFTGALETIFYKATNYWKGKHIGYIVAQKMGYDSSVQYDSAHSNRRYYFERAIEICKKWGIPYLDLWNGCYLVPTNPNMFTYGKTSAENIELGNLYTDGQHLTSKGYDYISPIIEEWMRGI